MSPAQQLALHRQPHVHPGCDKKYVVDCRTSYQRRELGEGESKDPDVQFVNTVEWEFFLRCCCRLSFFRKINALAEKYELSLVFCNNVERFRIIVFSGTNRTWLFHAAL